MDSLTFLVAVFIGFEVGLNTIKIIYTIWYDRHREKVLKEELAKRSIHALNCECSFCMEDKIKEPRTEIYIN